jgi:hypothetical protein
LELISFLPFFSFSEMKENLLLLLLCVFGLLSSVRADTACSNALASQIVDDATLSAAISKAREAFLASRPSSLTRLDVTLLTLDPSDGMWHRGSYNQSETAYPASTVKLFYLVASIQWCKNNGYPYDCLAVHQRPMISVSDNFETGQESFPVPEKKKRRSCRRCFFILSLFFC